MTMSVCCRTRRPGSRTISLISSFIPRDSWMRSTSLAGEIYPTITQRKIVFDCSLSNSIKSVCKASMLFSSPYPKEESSIQERILLVSPPNLKKLVLERYSSRRFLRTGDCTKFVPILNFVHAMINNYLLYLLFKQFNSSF
jgi:hypothetical protein